MQVNIQYSIYSSPMEMGDLTWRHDFGTKNTPLPGLLSKPLGISYRGDDQSVVPFRCSTSIFQSCTVRDLRVEEWETEVFFQVEPVLLAPFSFLFCLPILCCFFLRFILRAGSKESSNLHMSCGDFQTQIKYSSHIPSTI